jgi:plasmid stability protein
LISILPTDIICTIVRKAKSVASVVIRNIPAETHRALRVRAAQHGRSTEAEIRLILEAAVKPGDRVKLGSVLAQIGREAGGVDLDITRHQDPADPVDLE